MFFSHLNIVLFLFFCVHWYIGTYIRVCVWDLYIYIYVYILIYTIHLHSLGMHARLGIHAHMDAHTSTHYHIHVCCVHETTSMLLNARALTRVLPADRRACTEKADPSFSCSLFYTLYPKRKCHPHTPLEATAGPATRLPGPNAASAG